MTQLIAHNHVIIMVNLLCEYTLLFVKGSSAKADSLVVNGNYYQSLTSKSRLHTKERLVMPVNRNLLNIEYLDKH